MKRHSPTNRTLAAVAWLTVACALGALWSARAGAADATTAKLQAIDVQTLSEAARSLGAGWGTVMLRIVAPNMRSALLNSALLSVALVLGEFTIAQLLNFVNLQVAINMLGRANAGVSIAVAVASLFFAFILLVALSFVGRRRSGSVQVEE